MWRVYCVSDVLMTLDEVGGEGKIATCCRFQQMIALQQQEADTSAETLVFQPSAWRMTRSELLTYFLSSDPLSGLMSPFV